MKLSKILERLEYTCLQGTLDQEIEEVVADSRKAKEGSLFICIRGAVVDGHTFAKSVAGQGTKAIIVEEPVEVPEDVTVIQVKDSRYAMALVAAAYYDYPGDKLRVIGITGTKGKTTTTYMVKSILENAGYKVGLIGTIETIIGDTVIPSANTTPESLLVQKYLRQMLDEGCDCAVMEVSSQALKYERVGNTHFDTAIFLNISKDHISPTEHKDFDDYFQSKLKIFDRCTCACVNLDSDHIGEILKAAAKCERVVTFGSKENAVIRVSDIKPGRGKFYFHVAGPDFSEDFTLPVHGAFNVENAVAAIAAAWSMGIPVSLIKESLLGVTVPGRMETYESSAGEVTAIVDFAHNGLSFEKMFDTVALEYPGSRVSVVFGTPGGKAFNRRKDMGEISGKRADRIFLVPDDPGNEDPQAICEEIGGYIAKEGASFQIRMDRGAAIREAILGAVPGEVVLILGKGADVTMHVGNGNVPYRSDAVYAKEALAEYGNAFAEAATAREAEE